MRRISFLLCIAIFVVHTLNAQKRFEIRYLGNMGIAIVHNDSTIIIDGLHDYYEADYMPTDSSAIGEMLRKQKPFVRVIAIAVTHRHSDHFDEHVVASVAKVHQASLLIGGSQTRSLLNADMQKRFSQVIDTATFSIGSNLSIKARRIPHTYPQRHSAVENYRIEIIWNAFRLVHLGDADTRSEVLAALGKKPDILVVPSWFLEQQGILLIEQINPAKVLATHISPADKSVKAKAGLNAEQILFKKYGDKININK
jgi:L-ascorbate metabolism protein UlaG (beta-lactamase superfamily)